MKARKPDGTRWFTPTAEQLLDRWFASRKLRRWALHSVELPSGVLLVLDYEQLCAWLAVDKLGRLARHVARRHLEGGKL